MLYIELRKKLIKALSYENYMFFCWLVFADFSLRRLILIMEYFHYAPDHQIELTPHVLENGRITMLRVEKFVEQCYLQTGVYFGERTSGWRPKVVNVREGGSLHSNHITAKAEDKRDNQDRLLARFMLANEDY